MIFSLSITRVSFSSISLGSEWVGGASVTPDNDVFVHLAKVYSHNHASMHKGNGCTDTGLFPDGITNGYQWYPLAGQHDAVKQTVPYDSIFSFLIMNRGFLSVG